MWKGNILNTIHNVVMLHKRERVTLIRKFVSNAFQAENYVPILTTLHWMTVCLTCFCLTTKNKTKIFWNYRMGRGIGKPIFGKLRVALPLGLCLISCYSIENRMTKVVCCTCVTLRLDKGKGYDYTHQDICCI